MTEQQLIENIKSGKGLPPYDEVTEPRRESDLVKEYISYLIAWITGRCDLELDPLTEFHVIRVIMDSYECFEREKGNQN